MSCAMPAYAQLKIYLHYRSFCLEEISVYKEAVGSSAVSPGPAPPSKLEMLRRQTQEALRGQLLEDGSGSVLLPTKYDVANIHF